LLKKVNVPVGAIGEPELMSVTWALQLTATPMGTVEAAHVTEAEAPLFPTGRAEEADAGRWSRSPL
jgi:hypothetical protein